MRHRITVNFGTTITAQREQLGLTALAVSDQLGMQSGHYKNIEKGLTMPFNDKERIEKLEKILGFKHGHLAYLALLDRDPEIFEMAIDYHMSPKVDAT